MDRELTITVTDDEARLIEARVESGAFASASEVIRAGLSAMAEAEEAGQRELDALRQSVDESLDDPSPSISGDDVLENIKRRYEQALKAPRRRA